MQYLLGIIGALGAGLLYFFTKAKSAKALLENEPTKKKINELGGETEKLAGGIGAEEERRKALQSDREKESGEVDNAELVNFVNAFSKRDDGKS